MYTIEQIEKVTAAIYAAVQDRDDLGSRQRMKVITQIYVQMVATESQSIDKEILDPNVVTLIDHFLDA